MNQIIAKYKNGNYTTILCADGTKIRMNNLDNLTPMFAESIDLNLTERCDGACNFCYLDCNESKPHGNLNHPILDTLHPGTELAINGNDLTHPDLEDFLIRMKDKGVFVNITINQRHIAANLNTLKDWQDRKLIWGIGISLKDSTDPKLFEATSTLNNTVLHVIDGCFTKDDLVNLSDHNIRVLILGYKRKGRGEPYYLKHKDEIEANIKYLSEHLMEYKENFLGFAFDNLSVENLKVRNMVDEETWKAYYMGEEGTYTFFLDIVNNKYAISSLETKHVFDIKDTDTVDTMFTHVRSIATDTKTI